MTGHRALVSMRPIILPLLRGWWGVDKMRLGLAMCGFRSGTEPKRGLMRPTRAVEVLCHFVLSTHPSQ